jgi:hypothetical protein
MKVKEITEELQKYDPELTVSIRAVGFEGGTL